MFSPDKKPYAARVRHENLKTKHYDGAHGIGVQNVTSKFNVATLNSFFISLYLTRHLASGETSIRFYYMKTAFLLSIHVRMVPGHFGP